MTSERVRIIHISDLHVGAALSGGGNIPFANAHDLRVIEAFETVLEGVFRRDGIPTALVNSGDVSAHGTGNELGLYVTIRDMGLAINEYAKFPSLTNRLKWILDLPGNHDYWNGGVLKSTINRTVRGLYFPALPRTQLLATTNNIIAVHGICSTCGATGRQQFCAVGAIDPRDLRLVSTMIPSITDQNRRHMMDTFHLLVTHHSLEYGNDLVHGLHSSSKAVLEDLHRTYEVKGILTGHAHSRYLNLVRSGLAEVRCSTSWQANVPFQKQAREFLVHEFQDTGPGSLEWSVTPWVFDGTRFIEVNNDRAHWL